jgi:hypothetical protein
MFDELARVSIDDIRNDVQLGHKGLCPSLPQSQLA